MKLLKLKSVLLLASMAVVHADKAAEVITAESSKPSPIYKSSVETVKLDSSSELDSASSVPAVNAKDKSAEASSAETQTADRRQDYSAPAPSYTQSQPASQGYYYYYYPITAETNQNSYGN